MSETIPEPVAAESRMVSVPGGRLNVRDFPGVESALVVMHGFPDDSRIYDRLAPLLAPPARDRRPADQASRVKLSCAAVRPGCPRQPG